MNKPRACGKYGLWLVRGDGAAGCAIDLCEAYRRWLASRWMMHGGLELVERARTQGTLQQLMDAAHRLP